ncbi:MAG: LapA family protein [Anaerolineales bacterium]|nr:LapA family protein [Anaerolineales bacterium]
MTPLIVVAIVVSLGWVVLWWLMHRNSERLAALDRQIEALEKRHEPEE